MWCSSGDTAFIAASKFEGAKPGYFFSTSDQGTGYYVDAPLSKRLKESGAAETPELCEGMVVLGIVTVGCAALVAMLRHQW